MQHNQIVGVIGYIKEPKAAGENIVTNFGVIVSKPNSEKDEMLPFEIWGDKGQKLTEMKAGDLLAVTFDVHRKGEEGFDLKLVANFVRRIRKGNKSLGD